MKRIRFQPMYGSKAWTVSFFISHIFGWIVATVQTIWIVWEIRRSFRALVDKAN